MTATDCLDSIVSLAAKLKNIDPAVMAEYAERLKQIDDLLDDIVFDLEYDPSDDN